MQDGSAGRETTLPQPGRAGTPASCSHRHGEATLSSLEWSTEDTWALFQVTSKEGNCSQRGSSQGSRSCIAQEAVLLGETLGEISGCRHWYKEAG